VIKAPRQEILKNVYAVILVGGKGKRLRPFSTRAVPKAFLAVTKDNLTMFRRTIERIRKLIPSEHILVVANKAHEKLVRKDFPGIRRENLLLEPVSRNTAPAIAFAAFRLRARSKDAVMAVLPTDHYIREEGKYLESLRNGIRFLGTKKDALVTVGLKPTFPATGFGYIRVQTKSAGARPGTVYEVESFVEKPDERNALRFLRDERYLWNTGTFIFTADTILEAIRRLAPDIYSVLERHDDIVSAYAEFPDISIDYAVMERADTIYCVKGSYQWKDMGSLENLKEILRLESRDSVTQGKRLVKVL